MEAAAESREGAEETEANPVGEVGSRPASSSKSVTGLLCQEGTGSSLNRGYT